VTCLPGDDWSRSTGLSEPTPRKNTGDLRPASCGKTDYRYYLGAGGRLISGPLGGSLGNLNFHLRVQTYQLHSLFSASLVEE
jgi:hypothetical protein